MLSDAAKMTESIHKVEAIINELPNQIDQLTNYRCPIQIGFASVIKVFSIFAALACASYFVSAFLYVLAWLYIITT